MVVGDVESGIAAAAHLRRGWLCNPMGTKGRGLDGWSAWQMRWDDGVCMGGSGSVWISWL